MIDYQKLADSVTYYEGKGFRRIESPWTVTRQVSEITKPADRKEFALKHEDGKVLVASGEQSFLYLYLKGFLPLGQYQTITPCFRHEAFDPLHTKYFVKNELIETQNVCEERLMEMVIIAKDFFARYFPEKDLQIVGDGITALGYDITYKGVELGSYGIRSCDFVEWIYATGIAEPRVSATIKKFELGQKDADRFNRQ
jgi:hypothetical protein